MADYVLEYMKKERIPLTRKNYIEINWLGDKPDMTPELEMELPSQFRKPEFRDDEDDE